MTVPIYMGIHDIKTKKIGSFTLLERNVENIKDECNLVLDI
jgi:hypothetical protein